MKDGDPTRRAPGAPSHSRFEVIALVDLDALPIGVDQRRRAKYRSVDHAIFDDDVAEVGFEVLPGYFIHGRTDLHEGPICTGDVQRVDDTVVGEAARIW